jgi:hypothetical protein
VSLPAILFAGDLAPLLGWQSRRVVVFLVSNGIAERMTGGNRRIFTTPQRLAAFSPAVLAALEAKWAEVHGGARVDLEDFGDLEE